MSNFRPDSEPKPSALLAAEYENVRLQWERAMRLLQYRHAIKRRRHGLVIILISLAVASMISYVYLCDALWMLSAQKQLLATLVVAVATVAGGDLYEIARDRFEYRLLRTRFDSASQEAPKIVIGNGLGPARFFIYLPAASIPPTLVIWLLDKCGLVHLSPNHSALSITVCILVLYGLIRTQDVPASFRQMFKLCKRIPGPDLN